MGNLCSSSSDKTSDSAPTRPANNNPFSQPGRTLSSAPAQAHSQSKTAAIPSREQATSMGNQQSQAGTRQDARQTLGGGTDGATQTSRPTSTSTQGPGNEQAEEARAARARAVAERQQKATYRTGTGKIAKDLAQQQKQTGVKTLDQASREVRGQRAADEGQVARDWN